MARTAVDMFDTRTAYGMGFPALRQSPYHSEAWRARSVVPSEKSFESRVWDVLGQSKKIDIMKPGVGIPVKAHPEGVEEIVCVVAYAKNRDQVTRHLSNNYSVLNLVDEVRGELTQSVKGLPPLAVRKPAPLDVKEGDFVAPYVSYRERVRQDSGTRRLPWGGKRLLRETRIYVVENAAQALVLAERFSEAKLSARVLRGDLQGESLIRPQFLNRPGRARR